VVVTLEPTERNGEGAEGGGVDCLVKVLETEKMSVYYFVHVKYFPLRMFDSYEFLLLFVNYNAGALHDVV